MFSFNKSETNHPKAKSPQCPPQKMILNSNLDPDNSRLILSTIPPIMSKFPNFEPFVVC